MPRGWSSRPARTWASIRASKPTTPTRRGSARFRSTAGTTCASRWSARATSPTSCRSPASGRGLPSIPVPTIRRTRRRSATARPPAARRGGSISTSPTPATPPSKDRQVRARASRRESSWTTHAPFPACRIFFMDKGYSAFVLTRALGGQHLDLGEEEEPLQPLARIDDPTDRMKVQVLLEDWIALQNVKLLPQQTKALYRALTLLAEAPLEQRTITNLITQVQDPAVRDGAQPFVAGRAARALSRR